jgi:hypothetical protein
LRWSLLLETIEDDIRWTTNSIQKSIDEVLQAGYASLHLHMRGLQNIADHISLLLIDPVNPNEIIQEEHIRTNVINTDWLRISLGPFRTTLGRYEQASQLELYFQYHAFHEEESVRLPLALFTRNLDIQNVGLKPLGELTWLLHWDEPYLLRNRRVLIGSAWQPWQNPFEFQIPDRAQGKFVIQDIGLLPSRYHVYFYTAPTFAPPKAQIPSSGFFEITTTTLEARLAELLGQKPQNPSMSF